MAGPRTFAFSLRNGSSRERSSRRTHKQANRVQPRRKTLLPAAVAPSRRRNAAPPSCAKGKHQLMLASPTGHSRSKLLDQRLVLRLRLGSLDPRLDQPNSEGLVKRRLRTLISSSPPDPASELTVNEHLETSSSTHALRTSYSTPWIFSHTPAGSIPSQLVSSLSLLESKAEYATHQLDRTRKASRQRGAYRGLRARPCGRERKVLRGDRGRTGLR